MKEKTAAQIANMKKQTIGVEIEMNGITRNQAAQVAAAFFGTNRSKYTGQQNGYMIIKAANGNSREIQAFMDATMKNANSLHQFFATRTSKHFRHSSEF